MCVSEKQFFLITNLVDIGKIKNWTTLVVTSSQEKEINQVA
jgi:hypothetical protein